jgi:hypothetical protein
MSGEAASPLLGAVNFPPEWVGLARLSRVEAVGMADMAGGRAYLLMALLSDGSNLMGLCYPGGEAALRVAPMSNTVEGHFTGAKPSEDPTSERLWGIAVESMHAALTLTREEMGL